MASFGVFRSPKKMNDQDKWIHHLVTKTELAIIATGLALGGGFWYFVGGSFGFVVCVLLTVSFGIAAKVPVPPELYLYGGGYPLYVLLLLKIRRMTKRYIYVKFARKRKQEVVGRL